MSVYALDSNIISFYLRGNSCVADNIERAIRHGEKIVVAPIAYYEVKRGLMLINATKQLKAFATFCQLFEVGTLSNALLEESVAIYIHERKAKRNTEDADIFIAAFCLYNNYTLVTGNTKHFRGIDNLAIVDWTREP